MEQLPMDAQHQMVGKSTSSCSMGAIWRQAVCILIVLLFLVEEKMFVRIWLLAQACISSYQEEKKKKNTPWQMLRIKDVLTISLCMMFEDSLKIESCRFLTYFLRLKDYMHKALRETHIASTKQLNIRLEKGEKIIFILKLLYLWNDL